MVQDRDVSTWHLLETGVGLSQSQYAIILAAMATEMGETLYRSPRNAEKAK